MCSITAHNKKQPKYVDDASSGGGRAITNDATIKITRCDLKFY